MLLERAEDDVLVVRFNRPEAANALDTRMGRDALERPPKFTGS